MPTLYTHTTFAQAKQRLSSLLGAEAFWTDAELGVYIVEALRWWGLAAQYWRDTARVTLNAGQGFYDVASLTLEDGSAPQSQTVTDREVINDACYQLMEPPITVWAGDWPGSEMFSLVEIQDLLAKSRDDLRRMSGVVAREVTYAVEGGQQRVDLADNTIHILRASIEELGDAEDGTKLPMWPMDYYQAQALGTPATGRPKGYVTTYTPTLAVDIFPPARTQSKLRLYVVEAGSIFLSVVAASVIGLPDDACWIAKYRLMDDLLSGDGLSKAPELAAYCRQRWQQGLEMLAQYQSLLWATVGGQRMTISSLGQLDAQRADWQATWGTPRSLHMLNWNLFASYPLANEEQVVEIQVVRKAPIPVANGDFIQVGREQMSAIYDYATHIAMFKCQGGEFLATMDLLQNATQAAQQHQAALAGTSVNWVQQQRLNKEDRLMRHYWRKESVGQAGVEAKEAV